MLLAIDIGNSTVAVGLLQVQKAGECRVVFTGRLSTGACGGSVDCSEKLAELLEEAGHGEETWDGAIVSSVVPRLTGAFCDAAMAVSGCEAHELTWQSQTGLSIQLPYPDRIGRDRLADAAAVVAHYPLPALTVDMGTATTFNVIDENKQFLGGVIATGVATGLNALAGRTAQLPKIELSTPESVIGKDTAGCMLAGAVAGTAAMIDGIAARVEAELGKPVSLILTGGHSRHVAPLCLHPHVVDPDLLLKGLATIWQQNR